MVALCDILGFKDLVKSRSLDSVVDGTLGYLRKVMSHSVNKDKWPECTPSLADINRNSLIGVVWFSDTILLWTKQDDDENVRELIETTAWLLFESITGSLQIRGALAYGEAVIDSLNLLFAGLPIVEAHELEQRQQWSGAALAPSAVERLPSNVKNGLLTGWPIVQYDVPVKAGGIIPKWAINWTYGVHPGFCLNWSSQSVEPTESDWQSQGSICQKWMNTRDFHQKVCRYCGSGRKH